MSKQISKPKSILKNNQQTPPAASTKQQHSSDPREVAIKHARIIHSRREVEDQIADSMIELSKFPTIREPPYNASNPAPTDAESFKDRVRLYQPGDYDDLIEERNANELCGYTLCPNPRSRVSSGGAFKLVNYGRKDFNIVPRRELEKWCSRICAKRAMYVKVQLNETAAWERAGIASIQIELYEEDHTPVDSDATTRLAKDVETMKIEAQNKAAQNAKDLAIERGESTTKKKTPQHSIKLTIREKPIKAPAAPSPSIDDQSHLITEGYRTTFGPTQTAGQQDQNAGRGET
ncbi:Rtr1/RPAP2 family-domain-containing protein [Nemania serpens]|nr:Rtr1/RPAP2 family-domain-containing protein [Nemania serpens]